MIIKVKDCTALTLMIIGLVHMALLCVLLYRNQKADIPSDAMELNWLVGESGVARSWAFEIEGDLGMLSANLVRKVVETDTITKRGVRVTATRVSKTSIDEQSSVQHLGHTQKLVIAIFKKAVQCNDARRMVKNVVAAHEGNPGAIIRGDVVDTQFRTRRL